MVPGLLAAHAVSSWDAATSYFGLGKALWTFSELDTPSFCWVTSMQQCLVLLNSQPNSWLHAMANNSATMSETWQKFWAARTGKDTTSAQLLTTNNWGIYRHGCGKVLWLQMHNEMIHYRQDGYMLAILSLCFQKLYQTMLCLLLQIFRS